jgi:alpha-beta hydrolase superfamily lysophospholipase
MSTTELFSASDGTRLLRRTWIPPEDPRATILIVHGAGDHSGRFEHVGEHLARSGYAVTGVDLRGHGGSGGPRGHADSWEQILDDLTPPIEDLRASGLPAILYGHSVGGLIALTYVQSDRPLPDLLVLSAPALDASVPGWKQIAARLLSRIAPRLRLSPEISGEHLATDPAVGEAYLADPLVETSFSTRFGAETMGAMSAALERLQAGLPVATLVIHGGADSLIPTISSEVFAGMAGVDRVVLDGLRHETHNEAGGAETLRTVCAWLDRRLGSVESA